MLHSGAMFHLHTIQLMTAHEISMVSNQVNHKDGSKSQISLVNLKINDQIRFQITIKQDLLSQLEGRMSSWEKMDKVVPHILKLKAQLLQKIKQKKAIPTSNMESPALVDVELLQEVSDRLIKLFQAKHFKDELGMLKQKERSLSKSSVLCFLDPLIDRKGIIEVRGWIRRSGLNEEYMHLIILPKKSKVTKLIVKWCHLKAAYSGRDITLNEIKDKGFWIINASSITKSVVFNCITCRKRNKKMGIQIMADLPKDRF